MGDGETGISTETEFGALVEHYRRELRVHCYRMLGSFEDAEDLTQETMLRAWRGRSSFEGRASIRTWLYRIATNACLDFLDRHSRRPTPYQTPPGAGIDRPSARPTEIRWLQPYPDDLLEGISAPREAEPESALVAKETLELSFLIAIQHLPPRQRAVLILRDVVGWNAEETATSLETTVASVKSALQRARSTLREHLPTERGVWALTNEPNEDENRLLRRYMDAMETANISGLAELLTEEARLTMPPLPLWFVGREAIADFAAEVFAPGAPRYLGTFKLLATRANRQPAAAKFVLGPGESRYRAQSLDVLTIENSEVTAITTFGVEVFDAFGLPKELN